MNTPSDPAARRFWAIQLMRVFGVTIAVCGLIVLGDQAPDLPRWSGLVLVLAGMVVMAVIPRNLARRWRTPPQDTSPQDMPDP